MNIKKPARHIPVIVGIGELIDKTSDPRQALEPLALLEQCARAADADAGGGLLRHVDAIRIVASMSWPYRDLPGALAKRLRLRSVEAIHGPIGGESPVRHLVDLAADIADGISQAALLGGAEATKALMQLMGAGKSPDWSDPDPDYKRPTAEDFVTPLASRYGLTSPIDVYPIYENACRKAWGQSFAEAQQESGVLWENNSKASARNPYAWVGKAMSGADIVTPGEKNRPIAWPYQKFMVANNGVNQASMVLLTSLELAREMGVPEEKIIYVWAGAGGHEPYDFLARDRYDHAPALELAIGRALELNRIKPADIDLFELYSCFPIVPKLARRTLGLPADKPTSVTGGLTFFGGPANNYMTHAITAMVRALRSGEGKTGFLHGNGEYVTKHHAAIIATTPPPAGVEVRNQDLQPELDANYAAVPEMLEDYEGAVTIETFTVMFTPKGEPDRGVVIARTPDGKRVLGRVLAADAMAWLIDPANEPIGASGFIYDGRDGLLHWGLQIPATRPEPAVKFEMLTPHIALVTLNRPDKRNCINGAVTRMMVRYVKKIESDPEIRVAILTGAGGKAFCAGADLAEAAAGRGAELGAGGNGFAGFINAKRKKPWIAAVQGFALGGGTELTLACDLAVAGENAAFGLPEVKRSIIAAAGGLYRLPRAIPARVAMEHILTGEPMTAHKALELHLVNRVVADDQVIAEAQKLAEQIVDNAPLAVYESRGITASAFDHTDAELAQKSIEGIQSLHFTEDMKEGPRAFLEKRKPVWKGR
ncbi:MAG: enoyl-CoA hydratase-related protein [Spongiibacteraceae bacterium]